MRGLLGAVAAGVVLVLSGVGTTAVSAAAPRATLKVAISGGGSVTSKPAGISCKPKCTMHTAKGTRVVLTASPNDGSEFSHWSAPCGTDFTCTVKVTGVKTEHAFFKAEPAPTPPPVVVPPPSAKAGHYTGTYTDGTYIRFDVSGSNVGNFQFDLNGACDNGGTSYGTLSAKGPFAIQTDLTFTGTTSYAISNGSISVTIGGTFTTTGSGSGTLAVSMAFNDGVNCTSKGTWTAQASS